MFVFLEMILCR